VASDRVKVERPGVTISSRNGVLIALSLKGGEKKREQITLLLLLRSISPARDWIFVPCLLVNPDKSSSFQWSFSLTRIALACGIEMELISLSPA
jgi:hypothetical protein